MRIGRRLQGLLRDGPLEYFRQVWVLGEYRGGTFVGADTYGNRYFEIEDDSTILFDRRRYVEYYSGQRRVRDASQIPADW